MGEELRDPLSPRERDGVRGKESADFVGGNEAQSTKRGKRKKETGKKRKNP